MLGPHRLPCETPEAQQYCGPSVSTRWVLPATILGSSLSFVDSSVVNVALPAIGGDLGTELATLQWVVNGYMLTFASLILLGGSAGDRFGRRRVFIIGLIGFTAASVVCGLAPSAGWLVAFRVGQGVAAALLVPASLALIGAAYAGEERGRAIGTWAAAGALTTALGPMFGGWLVDTVGWRAIFFVNPPVAALALLFAVRLPPDRRAATQAPLDLAGALLAVVGLGLISYGLITLGEGRAVRGAIALAAAVPVAWIFLRTEARAAAPMMPLDLFRNATFAGANGLTILLYASLSGALFLLPFVLIEIHGYSATAAGAAFLPFSVILGAGSRWSGALAEKLGARLPLVLGPLVTAAGYVVLGLSGDAPSYWTGVLPGLCVVGVGMTLCVAPLTTTVFASAPEARSGTASGINNAAARTGGLVAIAALGLAVGGAEAASLGTQSLANAYRLVMFAAAVLAGLSALAAATAIEPREAPASRDAGPG